MLSSLVGGIGIVALIAILVFTLGGKGGGEKPATGGDEGLPSVSIAGAIECAINNSSRINLNTKERVKACTSAKVYTKQLLVKKHGSAEGEKQFDCQDKLWDHESDWSAWAKNPSSDAYGIAQILPDSHGTPVGMGDWKGQVDWGMKYVWGRYQTSCNAWKFWQCTSSCERYPGGPVNKLGRTPGDPQTTWY